MTVHNDIDNLLAADFHGELSDTERSELQSHLLDCAICRQAHQETKIMNQLLEEKLEKPDTAFEQRMLGAFRNRVPEKHRSIPNLIAGFMRLRSAQIAGVAAVLLALVQVGRMLTHESANSRGMTVTLGRNAGSAEAERVIVTGGNISTAEEVPNEGPASESDNERTFSESLQPSRLKAQAALAKSEAYGGHAAGQFNGGVAENRSQFANAPDNKQQDAISRFAVGQSSSIASATKKDGDQPALPAAPPVGEPSAPQAAANVVDQRKLIRNARIDLEIISFEDAVEKITAFANEDRGYVATSGSQKQANGKLRGEVVVKVLPETLDRFLRKVRGLGDLKNQTVGTEDVTKAYFDTDARLKNARVMEQRLIDMLEKNTGKVSDLLQVEKELGRVREEIEKMQGELKFWDSEVQFATVTISLAEKDLKTPAAFLLKEHAQLALYTPEVEKVYNDIKALASSRPGGMQITNAQLDRDNAGRVSARMSMLIEPDDSDAVIGKIKEMGRVENFQVQTQRVAQGGEGMSENAKTKRDQLELNITVSGDEQEQALQQTNLRIRTSAVDDKTKQLRDLAARQNGRVRSSSFSRDPNGREFANVTLRVPMKNYNAFMQSLDSLGKVEDVSVQRQDGIGQDVELANAPADLRIQIYSQGHIVSSDTGIFATLRNTIGQGAGALMWSVRMIGVAIAFLAPWVIALVALIWIVRRIARARRKL